MNHRYANPHTNSLKEFKDLKARFDALKKELQHIHAEWTKFHKNPNDNHYRLHRELIGREVEIYSELQQLLSRAIELLQPNIK